MLKKSLKKLLALTLTTVTLVTSAMPVSASTLTPKKSHSKAEITEYVDYFNEITDAYTFRPDGYIPVVTAIDHDSQSYASWQMTELLQNTPGITSEQKADMKKAASKWKKSYMSGRMLYVYQYKWSYKMWDYIDDGRTAKSWASKYKAKVKKTYTEIDAYLAKNAKYNQKLSGELRKFNKQRLNIYNKAIDNWFFKMTKSQKAKYKGSICGGGGAKPKPLFSVYIDSMFHKSKMSADPGRCTQFATSCTKHSAVDDYYDTKLYASKTLKLAGYDLNPNGANPVWNKHSYSYLKW